MKKQKKYTCPMCGKKYFKFLDMDLCALLDAKIKQRLIPISEYQIRKTV
jgi:hypothetical protein